MISEKDLVYEREKVYLALLIIFSVIIYVALIISIVGIFILLAFLLLIWFFNNMALVSIRKNGVKVSSQQFPQFFQEASQLAQDMELASLPDIYIIQSGGILNAFASKFGLKNMVVIYADIFALVEAQGGREVRFILAHEFAHLKRRHVSYAWLFWPGTLVPILSSAYSRACEITCDRFAAYYTNNYAAAKNALVLLSVGPQLYPRVNHHAFTQQIREENSVYGWLDEISSTHPNLPKRIYALNLFFDRDNTAIIKTSKKPLVMGLISLIVASGLMLYGSSLIAKKVEEALLNSSLFLDDDLGASETYGMNELMVAIIDDDTATIEELATHEELLTETDNQGYTALQLAVNYSDAQTVKYLLEQGSNPNTTDDYAYTPLMDAVVLGDIEMVEVLVTAGADILYENDEEESALSLAVEGGYDEIVQLLENN